MLSSSVTCSMTLSDRQRGLARAVVALSVLLIAPCGNSQNIHGPANVSKTISNLLLSWTGIGTLQSSVAATGSWQDVLEASSPHGTLATNAQHFFRVISRWSRR